MKYILTTLKTYTDFVNEYNTDKLSRFYKLHVPVVNKYLQLEIFNNNNLNLIEDKDFKIEKYLASNGYENEKYIFYIDDIKYRLDFTLFKNNIEENNESLHDKIFISISFSLYNSDIDTYDIPTRLNNQYEVLNDIIFY